MNITEEAYDAALIRANKAEADKADCTRALIEHIAARNAALDRATRAEAALAAVEALADGWVKADDLTRWGNHDRRFAADNILHAIAIARTQPETEET